MKKQIKKIFISVIIPSYNSSSTIIESIISVVKEFTNSKFNWELIVVDDGSDDDSAKLVSEYITNSINSNNIYLISQENGGVAAARNTGLKIAKGDYIAFNDSDDKWLKGKIQLQMDYLLNNKSVDMVGGVFDEDILSTIPFKNIKYDNIISIKDQVLKNYFSPQTTIFKKDNLNKVGLFNEEMRYAEEGYFFNRMVFFYKCVILNKKVTVTINNKGRWGDSGLSGNLKEMEKGELYNIHQAYKANFIKFPLFVFAIIFSVFKYFRRLVLTKIKII